MSDPAEVVRRLAERGLSVAVAESLTGGQLSAAITSIPGASSVFMGGVVAYNPEVKRHVLGVPDHVIAHHGVVSGECAAAMAAGVRRLLDADIGLATTGVAGPEESEGHPVGTVFIAVFTEAGVVVERFRLLGDRAAVQSTTCAEVLRLLLDTCLSG